VNFSLPLRAFEPSLRGLRNLLQLSNSSVRAAKFIFCSSTAAVLGPNHPAVIPETVSAFPEDSDTLGYSKSKWVAEAICTRVAASYLKKSSIKILRIGQLTGDTEYGAWNMSEAYPLMLSTVNDLGCLPRVHDKASWLPLDTAGKTVCEIAFTDAKISLDRGDKMECEVYHLLNDDNSISFIDLLGWLKMMRKERFVDVEPRLWLEKLEKLENHPAKALLGLWKPAYGGDAGENTRQITTFETKAAQKASKTMRRLSPIDIKLFGKIWRWVENEIAQG
jgi:thioester reductase-like protein